MDTLGSQSLQGANAPSSNSAFCSVGAGTYPRRQAAGRGEGFTVGVLGLACYTYNSATMTTHSGFVFQAQKGVEHLGFRGWGLRFGLRAQLGLQAFRAKLWEFQLFTIPVAVNYDSMRCLRFRRAAWTTNPRTLNRSKSSQPEKGASTCSKASSRKQPLPRFPQRYHAGDSGLNLGLHNRTSKS